MQRLPSRLERVDVARDDPRPDAELLAAARDDPAAFGHFYRRHVQEVLQFFVHRLRDPELAADLTGEVFAAALIAAKRFKGEDATPRTWLYAIARHKLADSLRRGQIADKARRRLGMQPVALEDDDIERIQNLAAPAADGTPVLALLADLPADTREVLTARVIEERDYDDIARELECSESVVRQRVSRGLSRLRSQMPPEEGA